MTPQAIRGKRIFLVLAAVLVLERLSIVVFAVANGIASVNWWQSVIVPIVLSAAVISLWWGENWLRWLVAGACLISGGSDWLIAGHLAVSLLRVTPIEQIGLFFQVAGVAVIMLGCTGMLYFLAGAAFLLSPSLKAFFAHQREARLDGEYTPSLLRFREYQTGESLLEPPRQERLAVGRMSFPSGIILIADPQYVDDPLRVSGIPAGEHTVYLEVLIFPEGGRRVARVRIEFAESNASAAESIGEIGIDSAKVVFVDASQYEKYWTETGLDRLGVVSTLRDQKVVRLLKKHYGLDCAQVNPVRAEVTQPISPALEKQIIELLQSIPQFAEFPFMHFYVQTNNTFERINFMNEQFAFIQLDESSDAKLFAVETGYGDGVYPVFKTTLGDRLLCLEIRFIDAE